MTSCGETSERTAAALHGVVALLYTLMLAWHAWSTVVHLRRHA
ncbi:MAG TPA: hypothetical protein VEA38_00945 [Terriglobales bacterium]|nr:hypothetical protein [Terriglobales bacterium]